jgi:hypothetical protein
MIIIIHFFFIIDIYVPDIISLVHTAITAINVSNAKDSENKIDNIDKISKIDLKKDLKDERRNEKEKARYIYLCIHIYI